MNKTRMYIVFSLFTVLMVTTCTLEGDIEEVLEKAGVGNNNNPNKLAAPSGVTATAESSSSIIVSWNSVSGADGYYVYHSLSESGDYSKIGYSLSPNTTYPDTGLSANTIYYYKVLAFSYRNNGIESSLSSPPAWATTFSSSSSVPGSSASNAITISSSAGINGSFPAGLDAVWYKFTKTGTGSIYASDKKYSSSYTADIVVDVFNEALILITGPIYYAGSFYTRGNWENIDVGASYASGYSLYADNWGGTYYVRVRPYNDSNSNKGTFVLFVP